MAKKIVITGGIGYIGTELCKIYSGISWNNEILVIDNRFISERVNQLRNWGIDFVHGDILDKNLISKYCKDADVVHHLAGITDVPRVKSESSNEKDLKIKAVAEEGTQNIIDAVPSWHISLLWSRDRGKTLFESELLRRTGSTHSRLWWRLYLHWRRDAKPALSGGLPGPFRWPARAAGLGRQGQVAEHRRREIQVRPDCHPGGRSRRASGSSSGLCHAVSLE